MQAFIENLHNNGQHFVPIIDPFIHISQSYSSYTSGVTAGAFLNDVAGTLYIGQVCHGCTLSAQKEANMRSNGALLQAQRNLQLHIKILTSASNCTPADTIWGSVLNCETMDAQ